MRDFLYIIAKTPSVLVLRETIVVMEARKCPREIVN